MRKFVIAVDCDDVLVRTSPFFVSAYNRTFGTSVTLDGAHTHDERWQADRDTFEARLAELMKTDEYKALSPSNEEAQVLKRLAKDHELHVITARRPHERELTQAMLDTYIPGVFQSLELVGFAGSKGSVTERLKADMLIDDNVHHLEDAVEHGLPHDGAILFGDYPWNVDNSSNFTRCHTWEEVEKEVDRYGRTI
jgi:5'(3')-deoxyribonucleotidase